MGYDGWGAFVESSVGGTDYICFTLMFLFMHMLNSLVQEAMKNILVSLAVAFGMLIIVTWNWVISLLGLINIGCIVLFFLALFPVLGWTLDLFNTIFLIMSVGLSVDYTVHLLHAYNESSGETRAERAKESLSCMGITVLSGASTTLLSAIPLFGCITIFFNRFGTFIFIIIFLS